jgi:hypothetical protein
MEDTGSPEWAGRPVTAKEVFPWRIFANSPAGARGSAGIAWLNQLDSLPRSSLHIQEE